MINTRQKLTRYSGSLLLVLAIHAVAIVVALHWSAPQAIELPPAAMMIELAPVPEPAPPPPPKVVQPPQPPAQAGNAVPGDWHYHHDYLAGLPHAAQAQALSQQFLQAHMRLPASAAGGAKSLLLSGVVRLRSHPLLRGVAQRVPQHWQTRVKNWLRA